MMKKIWLLLLLSVFAFLTLEAKKPKYVFLFIGDGMATPQRMIGEEFSKMVGRGELLINHLPFHGTTRTSSANALITDSAAAATAIACGTKTKNTMIGIAPNGQRLESVAEVAHKRGKKIGIITTVTLNHATPAGFYGHRKHRSMGFDLGCDLVASNFEFFGGGGISGHTRNGQSIFDMAEKSGYTIAYGYDGMKSLKPGQKAILFAKSNTNGMPYAIDNDSSTPTLAEITGKAVEMLDNDNGFFIMVEGGAIDYAGHANESAANLYDVLALDDAVKVAYQFYQKHPEETLIIVTGDHETGAMTMGFAGSGSNLKLGILTNQKCSVGVFGHKLEAAKKSNPNFTFEDAKKLLTENFGFTFNNDAKDPMNVSDADLKTLQSAFESGKLPNAAKILMNKKAGIGWNSGSHTALPVLTTSVGCKGELFTGFYENTAIAQRLKTIL